jgi:4-hydroxy-tetrahydrodipicolinate synthase
MINPAYPSCPPYSFQPFPRFAIDGALYLAPELIPQPAQENALMQYSLQGILVAMVTPFTKDGAVDYDKVGPLAETLVDRGADGLFVCGTTGEGPLLSSEERKRILEIVIAAVGKRSVVIAHTGSYNTTATIALNVHAAEAGAAASGVITPGFYGYDESSLMDYYKAVAESTPELPLFLYNLPGCAINYLRPAFVVEVAKAIPNVVGVKDSTGDMCQLTQLINIAPKGFNVINGCDWFGYQAFCAGVAGAVSGSGNALIDIYKGIWNAFKAGDHAKAREGQMVLEACCRVLKYGSMYSVFKESMRLRGIFDAGYVRPPQRELTDAEKEGIRSALESVNLL